MAQGGTNEAFVLPEKDHVGMWLGSRQALQNGIRRYVGGRGSCRVETRELKMPASSRSIYETKKESPTRLPAPRKHLPHGPKIAPGGCYMTSLLSDITSASIGLGLSGIFFVIAVGLFIVLLVFSVIGSMLISALVGAMIIRLGTEITRKFTPTFGVAL